MRRGTGKAFPQSDRAPLSAQDRRQCYRYLVEWFASRAKKGHVVLYEADLPAHVDGLVESVVAGRPKVS